MSRFVVYRMYGAAGELLYIGRTGTGMNRIILQHKAKPWWPDVATITVEHFDYIVTVCRAELKAITSEHPRYNVAPVMTNYYDRRKPKVVAS